MSAQTFRTMLTALLDAAFANGWHLSEVQGELAIASMALDERVETKCFEDEESPW